MECCRTEIAASDLGASVPCAVRGCVCFDCRDSTRLARGDYATKGGKPMRCHAMQCKRIDRESERICGEASRKASAGHSVCQPKNVFRCLPVTLVWSFRRPLDHLTTPTVERARMTFASAELPKVLSRENEPAVYVLPDTRQTVSGLLPLTFNSKPVSRMPFRQPNVSCLFSYLP